MSDRATASSPQKANGGSNFTFTGDNNIDGLLSGLSWQSNNLTWRIPTNSNQLVLDPTDSDQDVRVSTWQAPTPAMTTASAFIFNKLFAGVSGLSFTAVAASDMNADLTIGRAAATPDFNTAYAYYPSGPGPGISGDTWFSTANDNSGASLRLDAPILGGYNWLTYVHEYGHTMGLKHGHETGGVRNVAMNRDRDSMEFSVMTYRTYIDASPTVFTNEAFGYAQTLMMYDIAALQRMYGANFAENSGATTYTFSATTGEMFIDGVGQGTPGANRIFRTLWDGNGVDTYNLSNYATVLNIDLNPGGWSTFSNDQLANLGDGNFARGNLFNALQFNGDVRSLIENAIGGSASDTITGNAANNMLRGNGGIDTLNGGSGDDTLNGGPGGDVLIGGIGLDLAAYTFATAGVFARLDGLAGSDGEAVGDTFDSIEGFIGSAFVDYFIGSVTLGDRLMGEGGNDFLYGMGSGDVLIGGLGGDYLDGGAGFDYASYVFATAGVFARLDGLAGSGGEAVGDTFLSIEGLIGSSLADILVGSNSNDDQIFGQDGTDSLYGVAGDDVLTGGVGADYLDGGTGTDLASYSQATTGVYARLDGVNESSGEAVGDVFVSIEGFIGSFNNDVFVGRATDDLLYGLGGNDTLYGIGGNDVLNGGNGNDVLFGGTGSDTFIFGDTLNATTNVDELRDFTVNNDKILLSRPIFTGIGTSLDASEFQLGIAANDPGDRIIYNNATGQLFFDADGNGGGARTLFATVTNGALLTHADFIMFG